MRSVDIDLAMNLVVLQRAHSNGLNEQSGN